MPVSHIGLTVTHLPTSCSFFLAALQPLGYKYIGQQGNQIGFGVRGEADFFICQELPGTKATAAHIAFLSPTRPAVTAFFTAALKAGGRIHGEPAVRDTESGYYNAAVLDFDGNSIEVVHRPDPNPNAIDRSPAEGSSRVLTWRQDVERSVADGKGRSVVSAGPRPALHRAASAPVAAPNGPGDASAKAILGTLLGAAAGAAVAYAMTKSEDSSAAVPQSQSPSGGVGATMPHLAAAAQSIYRALEAAPSATSQRQQQQPSIYSTAPRTIVLQDLEPPYEHVNDAYPVVRSATSPSASASSSQRPRTTPRAIEAPPPPPPSVLARSTLIATFVPPSETARLRPPPTPSASGTKSETHHSVRSRASQHAASHARSRPVTVVRAASSTQGGVPVRGSLAGSVLGLGVGCMDAGGGGGVGDGESVAPSDSVSQAGEKKKRGSRSRSRHARRDRSRSRSQSRLPETSGSRRPGGSRQGSSASTATVTAARGGGGGGGGSGVRGEVERAASLCSENDGRRSRTSSQRTVRAGDGGGGKNRSVASGRPGVGRKASGTGSRVGGGGGADRERSVVRLGLAGMGMGIGKGPGSSVESRAGGARGYA